MRWLLSWTVYRLGEAVWFLEDRIFGHFWSINRVYNWLMILSDDIQGNGPGPWKNADE